MIKQNLESFKYIINCIYQAYKIFKCKANVVMTKRSQCKVTLSTSSPIAKTYKSLSKTKSISKWQSCHSQHSRGTLATSSETSPKTLSTIMDMRGIQKMATECNELMNSKEIWIRIEHTLINRIQICKMIATRARTLIRVVRWRTRSTRARLIGRRPRERKEFSRPSLHPTRSASRYSTSTKSTAFC